MVYTVTANEAKEITLAPETETEEILQNVRMIVSTPQYSVPLDRAFGLSSKFVDKPLPVAKALIIAELMDAIEKYEPRATVESASFEEGETPGVLIPRVEVNI